MSILIEAGSMSGSKSARTVLLRRAGKVKLHRPVAERVSTYERPKNVLEETPTGMAYGKLVDLVQLTDRAPLRSMLSDEFARRWRDRLLHLQLLLRESRAENLGAIIYRSGDSLLCEIGPTGHVMLLGIDDDGSTLTYKENACTAGEYRHVSWNGLPPAADFLRELQRYQQLEQTAWPNALNLEPRPTSFLAMKWLEDDYETVRTSRTSSVTPLVYGF